jgi:hypothetical protein
MARQSSTRLLAAAVYHADEADKHEMFAKITWGTCRAHARAEHRRMARMHRLWQREIERAANAEAHASATKEPIA